MQITFSSKIENAKTLHLIEKSEQIEQNIYVDVYGTLDIFELEEKARLVTVSQGICGKALEKGGMAWRCPVCMKYPCSFICQECYDNSNHTGHKAYLIRQSGGGTCDCGDPESWSTEGSCSFHACGFTDENKLTVKLLPSPIRENAEKALDNTIDLLNDSCLRIDEILSESICPPSKTKDLELETAKKIVVGISRALLHLAKDVSPIFLHMIAARFRKYSFSFMTNHCCHIKKFDTSAEEAYFNSLCSKAIIDSKNNSNGKHPCSCTMIENYMRIHYAFSYDFRIFMNEGLLTTLMGNRRLKFFMALSYFANYSRIIPYDSQTVASLTHLSVQFIGYEDTSGTILQTEQYMNNLFGQFTRIFKEIRDCVAHYQEVTNTISIQICHATFDFKCLINEKNKCLFQSYLIKFVLELSSFHSINLFRRDQKVTQSLINQVYEIEVFIQNFFGAALSVFDFSNVESCSLLAQGFKESFGKVKSNSLFNPFEPHLIILHRCLSIFLTNYLITVYWLEHTLNSLEGYRNFIFNQLKTLFAFQCDTDLFSFIYFLLDEALYSIGLFIEVQSGEDDELHHFGATSRVTACFDMGLISILLSILPPKDCFLQYMFQAMHPNSKDIAFLAKNIKNINDELWEMASKQGNRTVYTLKKIVENSLYFICCLTSNDIMYDATLEKFRKNAILTQQSIEKTKEKANEYLEYSICRYLVNCYIRAGKDGITNAQILSEYPENIRNAEKLGKCLEKTANTFIDPIAHIKKFRLKEESFKLFDPFLFFLKSFSNESLLHGASYMKKIANPKDFDNLFGEFTKISSKDNCEMPFTSLFRENIQKSDLIHTISQMIECSKTTHDCLTPWLIRCLFKLGIVCLNGETSEDQNKLRAIMAKNISRAIFEEEGYKSVIKEYIKLIENIKEEEKFTEEIPELKRRPSQEEKARIKEIQTKVLEEFAMKIQAFKNKNKTLLSETRSTDPNQGSYVCSYCREAVNNTTYTTAPFGKVTFIQRSILYGHHINTILKNTLGNSWKKELQIKVIPGFTQGSVLSSCGHFIHKKCLSIIIHSPLKSSLSNAETKLHPSMYLCPICQTVSNALMPPADVLTPDNQHAFSLILHKIIPRIRKCIEYQNTLNYSLGPTIDDFKLISKYLAYNLNLIDVNGVQDFAIRSEVIPTLVRFLKIYMESTLYVDLVYIRDLICHSVNFLNKNRYKLFNCNLISLYCKILLSAKLMINSSNQQVVYDELRDKITEIVKLGIMQIVLRLIYSNIGISASYEQVHAELHSSNVISKLGNTPNIVRYLIPFLRKLLCLKVILFPTPGRDTNSELEKAGFLENNKSLAFFIHALDLKDDMQTTLTSNNGTFDIKNPCFMPLTPVNNDFMQKSWRSYLRHVKHKFRAGAVVSMPTMLISHDATSKPFDFISFPEDFNDLQKIYSNKKCLSCGRAVGDSAVCFLCGDILCVANQCCTKQGIGELTRHSWSCPGGAGIYLRFINNKVLLIDGGQACTYPSPYVNKYGESIDIQRNPDGGPLKLEIRIIEELKSLYLMHRVKQTVRAITLQSLMKFKEFSL